MPLQHPAFIAVVTSYPSTPASPYIAAPDRAIDTPVPFSDRLKTVTLPVAAPGAAADQTIAELVEALDAHSEKLNARLFTYLDDAVVARR